MEDSKNDEILHQYERAWLADYFVIHGVHKWEKNMNKEGA